jgi:hypothetical protein
MDKNTENHVKSIDFVLIFCTSTSFLFQEKIFVDLVTDINIFIPIVRD